MVGLALQRRGRNLPASVIDIGMVIGIGIIQKTEGTGGTGAMETVLRKLDYMVWRAFYIILILHLSRTE